MGRAERLLLASEAERALATLTSAWVQRRDMRLIGVAQRALAQAPATFATITTAATAQFRNLEQLMATRRWQEARTGYEHLLADLAGAAAVVPMGGWEEVEARIRAGLAQEAEAEEARIEAETALGQGHPHAAVELVKRFTVTELPRHVALPLMRVRERALEALWARGEGSEEALRTVRAQRTALEQADSQFQPVNNRERR
jgi:hypothetical protein